MDARRGSWPREVFGLANRARGLWYAPVLGSALALMMLRLLLMARILDVQRFAQYSGGVLVSTSFCMLGCIGLQAQLQRELPVNFIRGQERRGMIRTAQCVLVAVICCCVVQVLATLGASVGTITSRLLAIGAVHGLSQQLFLVATQESRSRGKSLRFANQNLIRAFAVVVLGTVTAFYTRSAVLTLLMEALVSLSLAGVYLRHGAARSALKLRQLYFVAGRRLRNVNWHSALILLAVSLLGFTLASADRWAASGLLDQADFAHYSFAWIILMVAQSVNLIVNSSVYPQLARTYGQSGLRQAYRLCARWAVLILVLGAVAIVPGSLLFTAAVRRWFPLYSDATILVPVFFAVALLRVSDFWSSYVLITGRESWLLSMNVLVAGIGVAAWAAKTHIWLRPDIRPTDVALLALTLTVLSYVSVMALAWKARSA